MTRLVVEKRPTYRAPGSSRRYLTPHSAFVAWAKAIIFAHCECHPGDWIEGPGPETCDMHERLFRRDTFACGCDGDTTRGCCGNCGREAKPSRIDDNAQYTRVRDRLVRWLKWRARREGVR